MVVGSDVGWRQGEKPAPFLICLLKEMPQILTDRIGETSQRTCKDEGKDVRADKRAKVRDMLTRREVSVAATGWKTGVKK